MRKASWNVYVIYLVWSTSDSLEVNDKHRTSFIDVTTWKHQRDSSEHSCGQSRFYHLKRNLRILLAHFFCCTRWPFLLFRWWPNIKNYARIKWSKAISIGIYNIKMRRRLPFFNPFASNFFFVHNVEFKNVELSTQLKWKFMIYIWLSWFGKKTYKRNHDKRSFDICSDFVRCGIAGKHQVQNIFLSTWCKQMVNV